MNETSRALMDKGEANRRILSKDEYRADFRRVEAASLKRTTHLASAEGKRMFVRCFYSFQASMYFVSTLGRTKLPLEFIEQIEDAVRLQLEAAASELNRALDGADALFKNNNIESVATYDTVPLEVQIGVTSALGRRYLELIHKLDQIMPLLQTLEIEEVITQRQVERQRSRYKRVVLALASTARNLSAGVRRRMNDVDARKDEGDKAVDRRIVAQEAPNGAAAQTRNPVPTASAARGGQDDSETSSVHEGTAAPSGSSTADAAS